MYRVYSSVEGGERERGNWGEEEGRENEKKYIIIHILANTLLYIALVERVKLEEF